jgi:hypothetical protein
MNRKQEKAKILTISLEQSSRTADAKELVVDSLGAALRTGDTPGETVITARFLYSKSAEKALNRVAQLLREEDVQAEITLTEI